MRVWIARRIRVHTISVIVLYTVFITICGFSFCTLFYCRNCQSGVITKEELAAKLSMAAHSLGIEYIREKEEHETIPKPPDALEKYGDIGFGKVHMYAGGDDCPVITNSPILEYFSAGKKRSFTVEQKILALCNQKNYITMEQFFTPVMRRTLKKLGEGVFGEVFSAYTGDGEGLAIKIMPIEGKDLVNDEKQKTFYEILPEMVISKELSDLGKDESAKEYTRNYVQLYKLGLCQGEYPEFLLEAWDQWDEDEESDNDRPDIFNHKQLYVLFAFENAGCALESFVFHDQREARSVIAQIAGSLAVGESALGFEHRDMHRGNLLVKRVKEEEMVFIIDSKRYVIPSEGVKVSIIDYTLSRVQQGKCISYNDLNNLPWLFEGKKGDLQHETYIHMKNCTNGDWSRFAPKTNAYWMNYIVNRMALKSRVKNISRRQIHAGLRNFLTKFPEYDSTKDIFLELFSNPIPIRSSKRIINARRV